MVWLGGPTKKACIQRRVHCVYAAKGRQLEGQAARGPAAHMLCRMHAMITVITQPTGPARMGRHPPCAALQRLPALPEATPGMLGACIRGI